METRLKINRMMARSLTFIVLALLPLTVFSQVTKGSISGSVVDSVGAFIEGAQIKATSAQTGAVLETTSDKSGGFRFSLVPPGTYTVQVLRTGFATKTVERVVVSTSQDSGLGSLVLGVAGAEATVEVSDAYTPLIETTQAQITTTFSSQNLELFTGVNENQGLDNLALLLPGVNASRDLGFSNSNGVDFAVNGLRGRNNDQQIDGQNNNDNSVAGPALQLSDAEFASEYQVVSNNFGPEYGRNGGSVVNIVTKSGTNNIHGSIYGYWTNNNFETLTNTEKEFEDLTSRPRSNTEFGGFTIGLPIMKDKVFFFNGFNEQLYHVSNVLHSDNWTPTPTGLTQAAACGVNTDALAALKAYGPYGFSTGDPFATNATNKTITLSDSSTCSVEMGGVTRSVPERNHAFNWLPRVDYVSGKNTFTARYLLQRNNWFDISDNGPAGYFYNEPAFAQALKLGLTRQISSHIINELSVSFGRANVQFGGSSNNSDPSMGNVDQAVANVTTGTNNLGYGTATNLPQGRIVNTWQIQDNFSYHLGKHSLKAGLNWTYQRSPNVFLPYLNGRFSFSSWTNYFLSHPASVTIANGDSKLDFREYDTFFYVGDDWHVSPNLTLNLGVTYSLFGQPANLFHDKDVKTQTGSDPLWDPSLDLSITTAPKLSTDYSQVAPSVGFAWTPGFLGKAHTTVIRGGYRLAYDPPFYNIYLNMASAAPQVFLQTLTSSSAINGLLPATPTGPNVRSALSDYLLRGIYDPRSYAQTTTDKNFTSDYVHSWSLGIQRELTHSLVAEARYVGNHGGNLFQSVNANPYLAGLAANFPDQVPSSITLGSNGREDGSSYLVRERTNTSWSDYHSLQANLRADNLFHQLLLSASYTYSKTTDNASEIFSSQAGGGTTAFSQNPLNYKGAEHGLSGLDFPHNFTLNFAEQIPFQKDQHGLIGHTLGGWGLSGTYFIASGQTYTPIQYYFDYYSGYTHNTDYTFNASFAGTYDGLRPFKGSNKAKPTAVGAYAGDVCNYYGGASCDYDPTTLISWSDANASSDETTPVTVSTSDVRYIMNSYYAQQVNNTPWGNTGRNDARDYWTNTGNLSVTKFIKLREKFNASLRANISNIFNHPNYSSIDPYLEDAGVRGEETGFGDPTVYSGGRRQITFSAKIAW